LGIWPSFGQVTSKRSFAFAEGYFVSGSRRSIVHRVAATNRLASASADADPIGLL
jgi:hypothetical protein